MKLFHSLILCALFVNTAKSQIKQTNTELDKLVNEYNLLFRNTQNKIDDILKNDKKISNDILIKLINDPSVLEIEFSDVNDNFENEQVSDIGLKWISDASHNFGVGSSEDDIFYRSRLSTGIDWVILGEGSFVKNKKDKNILKLESKLDSLEYKKMITSVQSKKMIDVVNYIFEVQKVDLLKKYSEILKAKYNYTTNLYNSKLIIYAELLKAQNEYEEVEDQIKFIEDFLSIKKNEQIIFQYSQISNIEIDLPKYVADDVNYDIIDNKIIDVEKEKLTAEIKNSNTISLRTKVRYNFYNSENGHDRNFTSIGASLTVPILFSKNNRKQNKLDDLDNKVVNNNLKAKEQITKIYYDFYLNKNKLTSLNNDFKYLSALLQNEIQVFKTQNSNFSPEKYIDYSIKLLQIKNEILDVNKKNCELYISYYYLIDKKANSSHKANELATYLWSKSFDEITNNDLINLLEKNKINLLFLSPGNKNTNKFIDFVDLASKKQIKVHRLIGENSYAKDSLGFNRLFVKLEEVKNQKIQGIHLNIEPHTFIDYQENKENYIKNLNIIYTKVADWCTENNIELSLSIPMHLPIENTEILSKKNIKTYIMAYENSNQAKLINRTQNLRKTLNNNYVWVLKLDDFKSKNDLDFALKELQNNSIENVCFYNVLTNQN